MTGVCDGFKHSVASLIKFMVCFTSAVECAFSSRRGIRAIFLVGRSQEGSLEVWEAAQEMFLLFVNGSLSKEQ